MPFAPAFSRWRLLLLCADVSWLAGGAAPPRVRDHLMRSLTFGAGVKLPGKSLILRYNTKSIRPPLASVLAALPLAVRGAHADYSGHYLERQPGLLSRFPGGVGFRANTL